MKKSINEKKILEESGYNPHLEAFINDDDALVGKFLKAKRWRYLLGLLVFAGANALQIVTPLLIGRAIDELYRTHPDLQVILQICILIFFVSVGLLITNYLGRVLILGAGTLFDMLMRKKMFKKLLDMSLRFYYKRTVGDIMALSINDLQAVNQSMGRGAMIVGNMIILAIASIIAMGETMSYGLTLMIFIPLPLLVFVMFKFGVIINRRSRKVQDTFANMSGKVQENITGIRVIKSFVREDTESAIFQKYSRANWQATVDLAFIQGLFMPLITFISSLSYLILIYFGGRSVLVDGTISIGDFVAATNYIAILIRPMTLLGRLMSMVQRGKASLSRIYDLFHEKPEITDKQNLSSTQRVERLSGCIEFKHLTFAYEDNGKPVLQDLNLTIRPGETVAFMGGVGSGKSTISNLLMRFFNLNERGQLFIDGEDIFDIPLLTLRGSIGYVPQDNFLFSDTISYNIGFLPKDTDIDEAAIENAAKASDMYDTVMDMESGFDSLLGEKGVNLSGGQKQRLCIARAVAKDAPIMIFDDCLSAVDTETENKILSSLRTVRKNRTCILIAHRISTVQNADIIVVLDQGRMIEKGTHQQLLAKRGYYYRIYQIQQLEQQYQHNDEKGDRNAE